MGVISKRPIRELWTRHPEAQPALHDWSLRLSQCSAASFAELRQTFSSADYVDGFVIFDVGGNTYRIATVIHFDKQRASVRAVMTHAEYDRNRWRRK